MSESNVVLTGDVKAWMDALTIQVPSKRCGNALIQYQGMSMTHLPCTRRKGHTGKHRIWIKRKGKRGRKHLKWKSQEFHAVFSLAT